MATRALVLVLSAAVAASALTVVPAQGSVAAASSSGPVLINEVSNDPEDGFFELRNWGTAPVDLHGWRVYRCTEEGLRSNSGHPEITLSGVLAPGELYTVALAGADLQRPQARFTPTLGQTGFGLFVESGTGDRVDSIGVYPTQPWPTRSECTIGANLPATLAFARAESWQRTGATGDPVADFITAAATPGDQNARTPVAEPRGGVLISEVAPAGPAGKADDFVELVNAGSEPVDLAGWELYRCTEQGQLSRDTLQTVLRGVLRPGDRFVAGGPGFVGAADARYPTSLADGGFGVAVHDAGGVLVDEVAVSAYADSACQSGHDKLPAILDFGAGESYQRAGPGFIIAGRTPGTANATEDTALFRQQPDPDRAVRISELATDPASLPGTQQNFIELHNVSDHTVHLGGWRIYRCESSGIRSADPQLVIPGGTRLAPGARFVAAREGTALAGNADAAYPVALNFLGGGVWVGDSRGRLVDRVGVFQQNEMDAPIEVPSPCTNGLAASTFAPDRLAGESYQRVAATGDDADDFTVAKATPGARLVARADAAQAGVEAVPLALGPTRARTVSRADDAAPARLDTARILDAWAGASDGYLTERVGEGERSLSVEALSAQDVGYRFPYQRFLLDAASLGEEPRVVWTGSVPGLSEAQLSVWDWQADAWRLLDIGGGDRGAGDGGSGNQVTLDGRIAASDILRGMVTVLVQNGPRTRSPFAAATDGQFEHPDSYDFAVSHVTDTQYLTETYPDVYRDLVGWILENRDERKIEFVTHTGDLVQNWVDPNQAEPRARREFERASAIQATLDAAGVPNSVLPGNHDNIRGVDNGLFNEFFGPARYEAADWYGGSIAPDDNSANFSTFEASGARMLLLSLPYGYGERELSWAEQVVAAHPDHNVVVSTHEHVTPKDASAAASRSTSSRWLSRADELWNRVIAPHRNVVLVLSGHFHGLGQIVTENAGGLPGHTVVELVADYQEFRTHAGDRATGFQRLLQVDLGSGQVAVNTFSHRLGETASHEYDYRQFVPDDGRASTPSNGRPWQVIAEGLQHRYTELDDEFVVQLELQYEKAVTTSGLELRGTERLSARG
ncbi:lamin tail domain-containing protein [Salinibacterium sp. ZJ454]|uniref:lamin tail domain-containing protein n=1 Tax=Salinibacterium sp. ZJ454 TaxID=2708339 RepID=UPI0014205C99|nr:lamin tail domain-containing protein [Salinibacterium sp. ZJ454]